MTDITIYHNPRCSKSRATLALLEERGVEPTVVRYLDDPPSAKELKAVMTALAMHPWDVLRRGEAVFKTLDLSADTDDADVIAAMVANPVLIERPIVIKGDRAVIGRPPENVLALID